jgi:hypothetical protein
MRMPCALEFAREGGGGQRQPVQEPAKLFFAKKVVGLMLQPLTLRKGEDSASTLSSGLHIILKCSTSTTTSISHLTYIRTYLHT